MNQAEHIISKFGGLAALSRALGHKHPTTVQGWKERGVIPARQQADVLAAAQELGLALSPEDFFADDAGAGGEIETAAPAPATGGPSPSDISPRASSGGITAGVASPSANKMWGGRFAQGPAEVMQTINASIGFDQRLYAQDLEGSRAHCRMLMAQDIITEHDGGAILSGLDIIESEIEAGNFNFDPIYEDIHMNIEARLSDLIGAPAGRLHTARSRNDQVATDLRLWVRDEIDVLDAGLRDLLVAITDQADAHSDAIMPGFTHLQPAQPVTFGHHLMAYANMFDRDRGRLRDARTRVNEMPLGAAALAGTSFKIDRNATAAALGFDRPMANSLDAVSSRDFALEFLAAGSVLSIHLSRLAEELVLWSSPAFGFVALSDSFSTGSSIMPQKRNPDAAELVRAKSGRVIGALTGLLVVLKGLPLAYAKDMQEDKEPVFDAADTLRAAIAVMTGMIIDMKTDRAAMRAAAGARFTTATDLADWLVRVLNMPFRNAHEVTGRIVALAESRGLELDGLTLADYQGIEPGITKDVFAVLGIDNSIASRTSFGGTAPVRVREAIAEFRKKL